MTSPTPQPTDVVLGGNAPPLIAGAVLGGLEGVKRRLARGEIREQIAALAEALNYGSAGQALIEQKDSLTAHPLRTAISFLKHYGAEHPAFQMLLQSQVREFEVVTVDVRGEINQRRPEQALSVVTDLGSGTTVEMVAIPGGTFLMGSPETELVRRDTEGPQHLVTVPPFYIGRYPVTQALWQGVAAMPQVSQNLMPEPSRFKGNNRPVDQVSWQDAVEFCDRLSRATNQPYRLPSEAEWEYACRASTTAPFHFGKTLTPELANYRGAEPYGKGPKGEYRQQTTEVGTFPANAFGLQDMHGNGWEWCADSWHDNYKGAPTDGSPWELQGNTIKVLRGGSWYNFPGNCRSASRLRYAAVTRDDYTGFRLACSSARTR